MREDLKAKASVALIISFIAFGCGTGASLFSGLYLNDGNNSYFNNNSSPELPIIYNIKNTTDNLSNTPPVTETPSSSDSEDVYEENTQPNHQDEPPTNTTNNSAVP